MHSAARPSARPLVILAALGLASEAGWLAMARLDAVNGVRPVLLFLGLMLALFACLACSARVLAQMPDAGRRLVPLIGAGAVLFRLTLLPAGLPVTTDAGETAAALMADLRGEAVTYERFLLFDHDIWRYLWDGHLLAHGSNPYAHAPADTTLDRFADPDHEALADAGTPWADIRRNVNHPDVPTIYPPLAQATFALSHAMAPGSVAALKLVIIAIDLLACVLLAAALAAAGKSPALVVFYAWNPLVIKVFAGSGHADALVAAALAGTALCVARRWRVGAAVAMSCAVLAKLSPVVLLPLMVRRIGIGWTALIAVLTGAAYLPFVLDGTDVLAGFAAFGSRWVFNAGPFVFVRWMLGAVTGSPDPAARLVCAGLFLLLGALIVRRDDGRPESFAAHAGLVLGALLVLSPAVMPWYLAWLLPMTVLAGLRTGVVFSVLVLLAFVVMIDGTEHRWVLAVEYLALLIAALAEWRMRARTAGAAGGEPISPVLTFRSRLLSRHRSRP